MNFAFEPTSPRFFYGSDAMDENADEEYDWDLIRRMLDRSEWRFNVEEYFPYAAKIQALVKGALTRSQTKAEADIEDHAPVSDDEDGSSDDEEQAWCFRCHNNFSMEHSGGDWGENEEWVCNHCLPACLQCHVPLFSTRQECCGEGRSDDCKKE